MKHISVDAQVIVSNVTLDLGESMQNALNIVRGHVTQQRVACRQGPVFDPALAANLKRLDTAQPEKWIVVAHTHFQQGLMALVRAIEQPEGF